MNNKKVVASSEVYVCTKPFEWFEVAWDKKVYPCCSGWLPKSIGQLPEQSPADIWNSEVAKDIRRSVLDGSFKYCKKEFCLPLKEKTFPVVPANTIDMAHYFKLVEFPEPPKMFNASYDQSCNLSCPSCRLDIIVANKEQRQSYDRLMQEMLNTFGDDLKLINITGSGDPFGSRHFWDLLQSGILAKYPNLDIRLHTNGQLLDEFHWNRIEPLHRQIREIEVSIDAASEKTYSLNRAPGDWQKLNQNMEYVSELRLKGNIKWVTIYFLVQLNNWQEMGEFVVLGKKWNADRINFCALNNWGTYSSEDYKMRAIHVPSHPLHGALLDYVADDMFHQPGVVLGFLDDLKLCQTESERIPLVEI